MLEYMLDNRLKIVCLNVQEEKHRDRVLPFLVEAQADVILLQEVLLEDLLSYQATLKMNNHFTPMADVVLTNSVKRLGLAILTRLDFHLTDAEYYFGSSENIPIVTTKGPEKTLRALLFATVQKGDVFFRLCTTHFTWTPDAKPNDVQLRDLEYMLDLLKNESEFIFAGDFNAPRGGPIFDKIASLYKDNIPQHITSTLDKNLHRAKGLEIVIDGLFTTPIYHVESVELYDSISDHQAIVATIKHL